MERHKIIIEQDKCVGCGLCGKICAAHNITIVAGKAETVMDRCVMCGQCSAVCPKKAISVVGYEDRQIEKDREFRLDPADVLNVIRFRRSVRNFRQQEIPREIIEQMIEAGRLTHTAENKQDVSFVVLQKEKDSVEKLAVRLFRTIKPIADLFSPMARNNKINDSFFFFHAPAVIVISASDQVNGILAAQNMEFVAEANGLGVLYSGFFTMAANASRKIKKAITFRGERK